MLEYFKRRKNSEKGFWGKIKIVGERRVYWDTG